MVCFGVLSPCSCNPKERKCQRYYGFFLFNSKKEILCFVCVKKNLKSRKNRKKSRSLITLLCLLSHKSKTRSAFRDIVIGKSVVWPYLMVDSANCFIKARKSKKTSIFNLAFFLKTIHKMAKLINT